jgi:endonuclease/exonuclease/phosphatase (EEP) superfamily protein YafD
VSRSPLITVAAWLPAALCGLFALVRIAGISSGYPLYPLLAFTPYVVPLSAIACASALLLRQPAAAVVAGLAAVALAAVVVPRVFEGEQLAAEPDAPTLRILSFNLGLGGADLRELERVARDEEIDAISLQELGPEVAGELRRGPISELLPHSVLEPLDGAFGSGLLAREPLEPEPMPPFADPTAPATTATLRIPDGPSLRITSIHPVPPTGSAEVASLRRYLDAIPAPEPTGSPQLLAGDFNSTLDHPNFRAVLGRGWRDAAAALGAGLKPTWPTDRFPPGVAIDHFLGDARVVFSDFATHEISGSDHRAIIVSVQLAGSRD